MKWSEGILVFVVALVKVGLIVNIIFAILYLIPGSSWPKQDIFNGVMLLVVTLIVWPLMDVMLFYVMDKKIVHGNLNQV